MARNENYGRGGCPAYASQTNPELFADPCRAIPLIRNAIFQLASGQAVGEVREGNSWLKMLPPNGANIPALRRLLFEAQCACDPRYRHGRAVRLGPVQNPLFAWPWGYGYGDGYPWPVW